MENPLKSIQTRVSTMEKYMESLGVSPTELSQLELSKVGTSSGVPLPGKPRARKLREASRTSIRCIGPKVCYLFGGFLSPKTG